MKYVNQTLKRKLYPTVREVQNAIIKADYSEDNLRDIRELMSILERLSIANPKLAGYILTRRTAVSSYDWTINGTDPEKSELAKKRLKKIINRLLHYNINAALYGAFICELVWLNDDVLGFVPSIKKVFKPYEVEKTDNEVFIIETTNTNAAGFNRLPLPDKINYLYLTDESEWVGGALRSIVYNEILRNDMILEWANFNRKIKGLIQGLAHEDEKADAGAALDSFIKEGFALTSKDVEFKVNSMTDYKGLTSFKELINKLEEDVAIAILGQSNTNQLPANGGSRAAIKELNLIRADIAFSDIQRVESLINDQLIKSDYKMNYGSFESDYEFNFIFNEAQDIEANARVVEIGIRNGIPLSKNEVYNKLNLSPPLDDNDVLKATPNINNLGF